MLELSPRWPLYVFPELRSFRLLANWFIYVHLNIGIYFSWAFFKVSRECFKNKRELNPGGNLLLSQLCEMKRFI